MLLIRPRVVSRDSTVAGRIIGPGTPLRRLVLRRAATDVPVVTRDASAGSLGAPPARQSIPNGGSGDDLGAEVQTLMPDNERESVFAYFDFDVSDNLTLYAQAIYGSNKTNRFNSPRGS